MKEALQQGRSGKSRVLSLRLPSKATQGAIDAVGPSGPGSTA